MNLSRPCIAESLYLPVNSYINGVFIYSIQLRRGIYLRLFYKITTKAKYIIDKCNHIKKGMLAHVIKRFVLGCRNNCYIYNTIIISNLKGDGAYVPWAPF